MNSQKNSSFSSSSSSSSSQRQHYFPSVDRRSSPNRIREGERRKNKRFAFDKHHEEEPVFEFGKPSNKEVDPDEKEKGQGQGKSKSKKIRPDFSLSGKLSEEQRLTSSGIVLKFSEPIESRKPIAKWRLYPFKGNDALEPILLQEQSAFLFGRDRRVASIPLDHPSCSNQHAVIQFRLVEYYDDSEGIEKRKEIKPYLLDLQSTHGTFLNGKKIEDSRYIELKEKDVLKFGCSTREFVLLREDL
jgi:smad nuclear-interacting protein 1